MLAILKEYIHDKGTLIPRRLEEEEDINGKIAIVTGANSGLGKATVLELAKKGATVILACRDMQKAQAAAEDILSETRNGRLVPMHLDLAKLSSLSNFVAKFKDDFENLHILINNAGLADTSGVPKKTFDGFEIHIGVNYLGHFLLTLMLLPVLRKSCPSRIVCVSSTLHLTADFEVENLFVDNLSADHQKSKKPRPYGNSKLALCLFALELSKRLVRSGITVYSLCPGIVATPIFAGDSRIANAVTSITLNIVGQTPKQGCETILYCALSKRCAFESGKVYRFGKVWPKATEELDHDKAKLLWDKSVELVNAPTDWEFIITT